MLLNYCYFLGVDRSNCLSPFSLFLNTVGAILELFTQTVKFPLEGCVAWKLRPSVFTREQMAVVKKKRQKKRGERKKETFSAYTFFKDSYMGFAFLLIFPSPLFKAGVKFTGRNLGLQGVGDHRRPRPRGSIWAVMSAQLVSVTSDHRGEEQDWQKSLFCYVIAVNFAKCGMHPEILMREQKMSRLQGQQFRALTGISLGEGTHYQ